MAWFKTPEVKVLLATMEEIAPVFNQNFAFDEARAKAERYIVANPKLMKAALIDANRTAKEVCLTTLINVLKRSLKSGHQRHANGMLTTIGQCRYDAYKLAMRQLVEIGYLSNEDFQLNVDEFRETLSNFFDL